MTTLDEALAERDRAARAYRRSKQAQLKELCADPAWGVRLHKFVATLQHFNKLVHAELMRMYVESECNKWLRAAPENFRYAALEAISEREQKIRMLAGMNPIDDPMPGEPDNLFRECKRMLGL